MSNLKVNRDFNPIEFQEVKEQLKEFLKQQDEFKDYNFEGSNISVLLDVMAYSIHYLLFYLNMTINEFFLEYTSIKDNAITLAKSLGYEARRKSSARGIIRLIPNAEVIPTDENYKIFIPAYTRFSGGNFNFVTLTDSEISVNNYVSSEEYTWNIPSLEVREGEIKQLSYTVSDETGSVLTIQEDADNIENSFLEVRVNGEKWIRNTKIPEFIDANSRVYFLTRVGNKLRISFGDGILGRGVSTGDLITIYYLKSSGTDGNGQEITNLIDNLRNTTGSFHSNDKFDIEIEELPSGGINEESLESIKVNAPKAFSAQGRAVTQDDFNVIITEGGYTANVWGGNEEFDLYSIPYHESTRDIYSLLNITNNNLDFFVAGFNPPYFSDDIKELLVPGDFVSEVNDDMVWQYLHEVPAGVDLPAPLEDPSYTYWQLTHKPKIGYVFFCGFNVNEVGEKIRYTQTQINSFKDYIKNYKIITLKTLPYNPNIIHYNFHVRVKRKNNFIGNTQELLNNLRDNFVSYYNTNFVGFNKEFVKSQLVDVIMDNSAIRYCTVEYTNFIQLFEPFQEKNRMVIRLYNKINPGKIKIKDENGLLIAYDDGSGKIIHRTYIIDPSSGETIFNEDVLIKGSRINYDNGIIEFLIVGTEFVELDFDNNKYIMGFEFNDVEIQNVQKENYINNINTIDINYTI